MALNPGDNTCTAGASKRVLDEWMADPDNGFSGTLTTAQQKAIKALCAAVARGIIAEILDNAEVAVTTTTTITPSNVGLQRVPTPNTSGTNTDGPSVDRILNGSGTGTIT